MLLIVNPSIQFAFYETTRKRLIRGRKGSTLSSTEAFLLGAAAKLVATVITYPIQVAQTRLRQQSSRTGDAAAVLVVLKQIWSQSGPRGMYAGMQTKVIQSIMMSALMFGTYEKIHTAILRAFGTK